MIFPLFETCCFAKSGKSARSDTPGPRADPPKLMIRKRGDDYDDDHHQIIKWNSLRVKFVMIWNDNCGNSNDDKRLTLFKIKASHWQLNIYNNDDNVIFSNLLEYSSFSIFFLLLKNVFLFSPLPSLSSSFPLQTISLYFHFYLFPTIQFAILSNFVPNKTEPWVTIDITDIIVIAINTIGIKTNPVSLWET